MQIELVVVVVVVVVVVAMRELTVYSFTFDIRSLPKKGDDRFNYFITVETPTSIFPMMFFS